MPSRLTSIGIFPAVCTASVCTSAPRACAAAAIASIGWTVPISLLACITETSAVSSVTAAAIASGETMPEGPTGTVVTCHPRRTQ